MATLADGRQTPVFDEMNLALQLGEVLLSSGHSAADTADAIALVLDAYGVDGANVDVTYTSMTVSHQTTPADPPQTLMRVVQHRSRDFSRLTGALELLRRITDAAPADTPTVEEVRVQIDAIVNAAHPYRRRLAVVAWAGVAAAIAALLGGGWAVMASAAASAATVYAASRAILAAGIPPFFSQVSGAFIATLFTLALYSTGLAERPSLVLVSGIVLLLAGTTFTGAVEDAMNGYYVTAGARLLEAGLLTGGIIAGVSLGLSVADRVGATFAVTRAALTLPDVPVVLAAAAAAAAGTAYAQYAPKRAVVPAAVAGLLGEGAVLAARAAGFDGATAAGFAAVAVGVVAYTLAGRMQIPAVLLASAGIVPLLPGLAIYSGLYQLADRGDLSGILQLVGALSTAAALSAGVILGKHLAPARPARGRRTGAPSELGQTSTTPPAPRLGTRLGGHRRSPRQTPGPPPAPRP